MTTTLKTIPKDWQKINLGVACNFERGIEPGADAYNSEGIGERFLRVVDITESRNDPVYVDIRTTKKLKENDIALTLDGTIGAVRTGLNGIYSTGVRKVSFKNGVTSSRLLYYILQSDTIQRIIDVYASGSTIKHASSAIPHLFTVIPNSSSERNKIAEILSTVDEAIEKTDALIEKYKGMKTGMMQDLFRYGIDDKEKIRSEKTHKFKKSPLGKIPEEWGFKKLGSLREFITSGSRAWAQYYSDDGALFIRIGNLSRENIRIRFDDVVYVSPPNNSEGNRTNIKTGDVLVSITADLGIVALAPRSLRDAYVNQHIALLRFTDIETLSPWVAFYLWSNGGQKQFQVLNDGGAKAGLNLPTVDSILIPLPSKEERKKIIQSMMSIEEIILKESTEKYKLERIKNGLMEDLLTGIVRVNPLVK